MTTRLKIGIQLPEVEYVASWQQHLDMARLAEDVGFDSLWLGDHLLYTPPLTITRAQVDELVSILEASLAAVAADLLGMEDGS